MSDPSSLRHPRRPKGHVIDDINHVISLGNLSQIGDAGRCEEEEDLDQFHFIDRSLKHTEIRKAAWVRDDLVAACEECRNEFTVFRRRHHCRCCGKIFCYYCTRFAIRIPDMERWGTPRPDERVCGDCYAKLQRFQKLERLYHIAAHLPLEILDLQRLALVSRNWHQVIRYILSGFRRVLTRNTMEPFSPLEEKTLWLNRRLFRGHSAWLLPFIQCMEMQGRTAEEWVDGSAGDLEEPLPCSRLLCTEGCRSHLSMEEALLCLSVPVEKPLMESSLMEVLWRGTRQELLCYLPVLVGTICYRGPNTALSDHLIEMAREDYTVANSLFWGATVQMQGDRITALYESFRSRLVEALEERERNKLQASFYFVNNLADMATDPLQFPTLITNYFETNREMNSAPIYSPVSPDLILEGVHTEGVRVRGSSSRPISIPFRCADGTSYELLYKHDDVRKDLVVMNIIRLTDLILQREEGLDLNMVTYQVLPISSEAGFIEIVPEAETLLGINTRKGFSILNFILEHNPEASVEAIRERFTRSCVAYCILSYLLGIGDRHMENIMVLPSGELFHIDFGFILGSDPKPLAPEIRITDEMVDAMGGYESKHYARFKELCARAFLCLRRHVGIFKVMFSCFYTANPPIDRRLTRDYIDTFIHNKFLVGENVGNAKIYLINKVSNRSRGYSESIIDFCHKAQDSGNSSVVSAATTAAANAASLGNQLLGIFWK